MPFFLRDRITIWPFPRVWLNLSNSGVSVSVKLWRWTWNSRSHRHSVNLPGPINWRSKGRRR